jgi:hypothetical protein
VRICHRRRPIFRRLLIRGFAGAAFASAVAAGGCAHGGVREGVYHAPKDRYHFRLPPGTWDRLDMHGVDLALTSPDRGSSILASTLCGRYARARSDTLSRDLFLGMVGLRILENEPVKLPAGEAQRIRVEGRVSGTPVRAEAYTFRRPPCIFDFVYLAAPDRFERGTGAFREMMRTLRVGGKGAP